MYHQNIMNHPQAKAGRPRNQALDPAILAAAVIGSLRVEDPPAGAPTPRARALAILENLLGNLRAIPTTGQTAC
jgi:hypothetical protein